MDANERISKIKAAKAVAESARQKKMEDKVTAVFDEAATIPQVLAYLSGASAVAWSKRPAGVFDSELCDTLVTLANKKIMELFAASLQEVSNGANARSAAAELTGFDEERADAMEREGDHA